jgi:site-specific recombinase XerC
MDRPELSPSYRHGRLSTVRGFALWLAANGHTAKDFTLGVKPPRVVLGVPKRLQAH